MFNQVIKQMNDKAETYKPSDFVQMTQQVIWLEN